MEVLMSLLFYMVTVTTHYALKFCIEYIKTSPDAEHIVATVFFMLVVVIVWCTTSYWYDKVVIKNYEKHKSLEGKNE